MLAERALYYFFLSTLLFVQGIFTYILYKHHSLFIKAHSIQLYCPKQILEKDTLRYQLKKEYLDTERTDIGLYNMWRGWVIFIPMNIIFALFMFVKYPDEVDSSFYYLLIAISLYQAYTQIRYLIREFGYPNFYTLATTSYGNVQNFISYYTQGYGEIYQAMEEKIGACHDPNAEYSCWDLLPSRLRENLAKRYAQTVKGANEYQAIEYFEKALKAKKYEVILEYMDLSPNADDLDLLGLTEHPFRKYESTELVDYMNSVYRASSVPLILPWIMMIYVLVFHQWYSHYNMNLRI